MKIEKINNLLNLEPITTKADLSRFLKVKPQTLSNWFLRGNIPDKYAPPLASYFSEKMHKNITEGFLLDSKKNEVNVMPVKVIANTSCGLAQVNTLQLNDMVAYIDEVSWNKHLYGVIANGDSMATEIYDGDICIIDPFEKPTSGDMVYYKIDGESAIKVLVIDEEAYIMQFIPYSPNKCFKTRTVRLDDEDTLNNLTVHKVVHVVSSKKNNRQFRLKAIGR